MLLAAVNISGFQAQKPSYPCDNNQASCKRKRIPTEQLPKWSSFNGKLLVAERHFDSFTAMLGQNAPLEDSTLTAKSNGYDKGTSDCSAPIANQLWFAKANVAQRKYHGVLQQRQFTSAVDKHHITATQAVTTEQFTKWSSFNGNTLLGTDNYSSLPAWLDKCSAWKLLSDCRATDDKDVLFLLQ